MFAAESPFNALFYLPDSSREARVLDDHRQMEYRRSLSSVLRWEVETWTRDGKSDGERGALNIKDQPIVEMSSWLILRDSKASAYEVKKGDQRL